MLNYSTSATQNFSILHNSEKGRYCVSSRSFKAGEIVLEEEAFVNIINSPYREVSCGFCGTTCTNGKVFALSLEDSVRYCSEECITIDYKYHSLEIDALSKCRSQFGCDIDNIENDNTNILCSLLIRISSVRLLEKYDDVKYADILQPLCGRENFFPHILSLESKSSHMSVASISQVRQVGDVVSSICRASALPMSPEEATFLFFAIQCNAHQILDSLGRPVALGLFPLTSMLNHSCAPNCAHHFIVEKGRPPRLVMVATKDVVVGEELCYSYVPLYQSTASRQRLLSAAYGFCCNCSRCRSVSCKSGDSSDISGEYPDDTSLDNACNSQDLPQDAALREAAARLSSLLEQCQSLASVSSTTAAIDLLLASLARTPANEFEELPLEHRVKVQSYGWLTRTAAVSLSPSAADSATGRTGGDVYVSTLRRNRDVTVGFAALALGCVYYYTRAVQRETADLELLISRAMTCFGSWDDADDCPHSIGGGDEPAVTVTTDITVADAGEGHPSGSLSETFPVKFESLVLACLRRVGYEVSGYPGLVSSVIRAATVQAEPYWVECRSDAGESQRGEALTGMGYNFSIYVKAMGECFLKASSVNINMHDE